MPTPKSGEVWMVDLGAAAKVRPVLIVSQIPSDDDRAISAAVPLTTTRRGSRYEVSLAPVPWLDRSTVANVQGLFAVGHHELIRRRGSFPATGWAAIKPVLRTWLEL